MTMTARALNPVDVSDSALYTEDRWREPFAQLRAEAPVSWREDSAYGGYWSVVTHDLIQQVELDPATYSSQLGNITIAEGVAGSEFPNFIAMDPPRHTEQRRVVAAAFTPSQMLHRERQVKERTRELLDSLPIGETFCWVNQVAVPLTIGMLAIVLDFPWEERDSLRKWSDMASNVSPEVMTEEYAQAFFAEMGIMLARFDALLEERRVQPPADDLLSRMVHSEAMGNLTALEKIANIALLIVGGNDTTRNSMGGLVEALHKYPDQLGRLRADRSLIANAAQEIVRWQSPVTHMRRTLTKDAELAAVRAAHEALQREYDDYRAATSAELRDLVGQTERQKRELVRANEEVDEITRQAAASRHTTTMHSITAPILLAGLLHDASRAHVIAAGDIATEFADLYVETQEALLSTATSLLAIVEPWCPATSSEPVEEPMKILTPAQPGSNSSSPSLSAFSSDAPMKKAWSVQALPLARCSLSLRSAAVSVFGLVFGISKIAVTPPRAAPAVPRSRSSLWVRPGSRKCTWVSMTPGRTAATNSAKVRRSLNSSTTINRCKEIMRSLRRR